jgi:hypothetical protein
MQNPINLTIERFQENGQDYYVATSPDIPELPPYIYTIIAENPYPSMDTPLNFS